MADGLDASLRFPSFRLLRRAKAALRAILRHRGLSIGSTIILCVFVTGLLAPLIAPYSPYEQNLDIRLIPPAFYPGGGGEHLLGTDNLGRDYLSRLIYGSRIALMIGVGTVLIAGLFGTALGILGGYYGGRVDLVVMFFITVRLSLPIVLVALAVVGLIGSTLTVIMCVLAGLLWDRFAVVSRATTQQLCNLDFIVAARAVGCSDLRIVLRELLPNLASPLAVVATLEMAHAIILEAGLSFLGLGVQPPEASWGLMIAEAKDFFFFYSWLINLPGFVLFLLVIAINLVGDGLRDVTAPGART